MNKHFWPRCLCIFVVVLVFCSCVSWLLVLICQNMLQNRAFVAGICCFVDCIELNTVSWRFAVISYSFLWFVDSGRLWKQGISKYNSRMKNCFVRGVCPFFSFYFCFVVVFPRCWLEFTKICSNIVHLSVDCVVLFDDIEWIAVS